MSLEIMLYIVLGMLSISLFLQLFNMKLQAAAVEALKQFNNEVLRKKQAKNDDIAELIEERNYEKALEIVAARLRTKPNDPALYWYLGVSNYHLGKWAQSKDAFDEALSREPLYKKGVESYMNALAERIDDSGTHNQAKQ